MLSGDAAALLVSAYVDCSLRLPDAFMLRFRDPGRIVVEKSGVTIGAKLEMAVTTDGSPTPEKLDFGRGDGLGGRGRRHRIVHHHQGLRSGASVIPRPAYRVLHAGNGFRRRHQGRPAGRPAARAT